MAEFQGIAPVGSGYCEFFDSTDGKDLEVGQSVILQDGKVRVATLADVANDIIGVVRAKNPALPPAIAARNATTSIYEYELDEFNRVVEEKYFIWTWTDENGQTHTHASDQIPDGLVVPENKQVAESTRWKKNANYQGAQSPAADTVGKVLVHLLGQVPVRKNAVKPTTWVLIRSLGQNADCYFVSFNNKPLLGLL